MSDKTVGSVREIAHIAVFDEQALPTADVGRTDLQILRGSKSGQEKTVKHPHSENNSLEFHCRPFWRAVPRLLRFVNLGIEVMGGLFVAGLQLFVNSQSAVGIAHLVISEAKTVVGIGVIQPIPWKAPPAISELGTSAFTFL